MLLLSAGLMHAQTMKQGFKIYPVKVVFQKLSKQKVSYVYLRDTSVFLPAGLLRLLKLGTLRATDGGFRLELPEKRHMTINNRTGEVLFNNETFSFVEPLAFVDEKGKKKVLLSLDVLRIILQKGHGLDFYLSLEQLIMYIGPMTDRIKRIDVRQFPKQLLVEIYYQQAGLYQLLKGKSQLRFYLLSGRVGVVNWKEKNCPFLTISSTADSHLLVLGVNAKNYSIQDERQTGDRVIRIRVNSEDIPAPAAAKETDPQKRPFQHVVIDPGHGGEDSGAQGCFGIKEKDLVFDIALTLKKLLEKYLGLNVILTRQSDVNVSLDERTSIANKSMGQLFVSLHANSSKFRSAKGFEVFYANTVATDDDSLSLARLENMSIKAGDTQGDEWDHLDGILWELAQYEYLHESMEFATLVNDISARQLQLKNRGVKQAPFYVLLGVNMPACLVEVGFISNKKEAQKILEQGYKAKLAQAIYYAIKQYKAMYNRKNGVSDHGYWEVIPAY